MNRVTGEHSLHTEEKPELCPGGEHKYWRVVRCDEVTDTLECSRCGKQREGACTFEEDCK